MNTAQRISSYVVAGAIALGLMLYVLGQIDALVSSHDRQVSDSSRAILKVHAGVVRFGARLAAAQTRQTVAAAAAHDEANALRQGVAHLPIDERPPRILVQIATRDSVAYAKCSVALLSCGERALLAEADARQLADQLHAQLKVKDHRCGVFVGYGVSAYNDSTARARLAWQLGVGCRISRLPLLP